jgi:hypothetical protein
MEANLDTIEPIEIFAVGVHPTDDGPREYSHEDLDRIVANFQRLSDPRSGIPLILEPTVVLGHEEDGDENKFWSDLSTGVPSVGVVTRIWKEGDKLLARVEDVLPEIQEALRKKLYRKVSAEIYDNFEDQGKNYGMALRRIAFLGGEIPQVKQLADILDRVKKYAERKGKVTHVTFFSENHMAASCPEKFCQEGPNKGKPGPCPGQYKGGRKPVTDAKAGSVGTQKKAPVDAVKPAKKKPLDVSGKVLDAVSGAINVAPEVAIAGALGFGQVASGLAGNLPLSVGMGAINAQNAARLVSGPTINPGVDLRATRDKLVKTMPGKNEVIPKGRTKAGSTTDKARRLYDAARLVASGRIDTQEKKEMVSKRITKELDGLSDTQVRDVAKKMGIQVTDNPRFDVAMGVLKAQHPGALARLRAGIRQRTGFSESQDFCEGCEGDCGQKQQSFFEGYESMDRAQMLEALQAMGVDTSVIEDATPDAVLEAWLKSVGGGAEEAPAEESFADEEMPVEGEVPAEQPLTPEEEQQMFADDPMMDPAMAGAADPSMVPQEEELAQMSCQKKFSERMARIVKAEVAKAVKRHQIHSDRKETIRQFSERLVAQGKAIPAMMDRTGGKPTLEDVLHLVAASSVRKFGEKKIDPLKVAMEFFEGLPQIAKFSEFIKSPSKEVVGQERTNELLRHSVAGRAILSKQA